MSLDITKQPLQTINVVFATVRLMCGRYVIYDQLTKSDVTVLGHTIPANFNVAPTTNVPIIRRIQENNEKELTITKWELISSWAKDLKTPPDFNARDDNLVGNKVSGHRLTIAVYFP